jgi:predicted RNase H-like HicB family nuclease
MATRRLTYTVEFDREADGRWIADVPALPGCMLYGRTRRDALTRVRRLAQDVVADLVAHHESPPVDHGTAKFTLVV